jgi:hypothetical protein
VLYSRERWQGELWGTVLAAARPHGCLLRCGIR